MTYIEQFEAEFRKILLASKDEETIVAWASKKLVESYRNGISAGQKNEQKARDGAGSKSTYRRKAQ